MSWFTYKLLQLKAHISPIFLGAVEEGIRIQLRSKVFRWVQELNGVFLAWKDIKIMSPTAPVYGDVLPLIEVPVSVKALVWCPEKNGLIQGVLVHKGNDFIAARVLGLWNAVIVKSHCNYLDKTKVNEGEMIRFRILNLQVVNNLLSIEGTLIGEDVGIVNDEGELHFPKTPNAAISSPPAVSINNPKKRRRKDEPEAPSSGTITLTAASPLPQVGSVSKKRILHELPDEETSAPTNAVTKKDHKDKKDKHKDKKEKKEKHKDKKDKHRSKHKDKSAVAAGE